jgi:hypothetical protein
MTPTQRTKARAFAIWRFAHPRDWNVTYEEIGEATGLTVGQVYWVIQAMHWTGNVRDGQKAGISSRTAYKVSGARGHNRHEEHADLTQIFSNPRLTTVQEFGIDWS